MKQMKKNLPHRLAAWLLCLCMFLSVFTIAAQATDSTSEEGTGTTPAESTEPISDSESTDQSESVSDPEPAVVSDNTVDETQSDVKQTKATEFQVDVKFQEKDTKTPMGTKGSLEFAYYNGASFRNDYRSHGSKDGMVTLTVPAGSIYLVETECNDYSYIPDMNAIINRDNGVSFAFYVSDTGVEPIHADNFDQLMTDSNFSNVVDGMLSDQNGMAYFVERTGIYGYTQMPTKEEMMDLLKEYLSHAAKTPVVENAGVYEIPLDHSKRQPLPPLTIVAVDENGQPLAVDTNQDDAGPDGVVFDSARVLNHTPVGVYFLEVNGVVRNDDGTKDSYIRKNAENTAQYPASTYSLLLYIGPDRVELVTLNNFDELCKDPQFYESIRNMDMYSGGTAFVKSVIADYPEMVIEDDKITLPFVSWQGPTIELKVVDSDQANAPLGGIHWYARGAHYSDSADTEADGMVRYTVVEPGLIQLTVSSSKYKYRASHEMFRYIGKNKSSQNGQYRLALWVEPDGTVSFIDDTKLKELCQDEDFITLMSGASTGYGSSGPYSYLMGIKADYESLKKALYIPGDYTFDKENGISLLPFTKEADLEMSGTKDETVFNVENVSSSTTPTITYECPEDGTYRFGWDSATYCDDPNYFDLVITGPGYESGKTMPKVTNEIELKKGTYTITVPKKRSYSYGYIRVFVEKLRDLDPNADFHTADYIKDGDRYTNMVAFSCGNEMEHMILAVYPGALQETDESWAFNVAVPSGADYKKDSLKLYYLPISEVPFATRSPYEYFGPLKDEIKIEDLKPLDVTVECTPAESFNSKTIYSMSVKDVTDVAAGDLIVATYTSTVNTAAWYGAIADINMSYGYWSIEDAAGNTVEKFESPMPMSSRYEENTGEDWVDPAICQVFGIKIYKYSNYDRMMSESQSGFDGDVMMQEHLLAGAEFQIEGENLDKVIVLRDDLVEMTDQTQETPALLRAASPVNRNQSTGSMLAQMMGEETLMKLLYYRYEQGLQELSKVSVAQTQTYYALNEDNLYTREAPKQETMQFYADNGQGYRLKPTVYAAKAGDSIRAGDGGGLLLGGLGAGEYTLTETVAPEGYALIKPMKISITWVKRDDSNPHGYTELAEGEVPVRNGEYGLICKIDGREVYQLMGMFSGSQIWYPGSVFPGDAPSYESIWNPSCYVLVNPVGDDRISFAAVKEVNDPGDEEKEFKLKYTIKDPDGNICTDVKYAISNDKGQFVTQDDVIERAEEWSYSMKPGEKIAFVNLPEGSTYEVKEEDGTASQYVVSYENETGSIQYGSSYPEAKITNRKATLVVSKKVTGKGDKSKSFSFGFVLTDRDGNALTDVTYVIDDFQGKINSGDALQLKHGESVTLYVPNGAHYKVEELEADQDGYKTTIENGEGTITGADSIPVTVTNHKDGKTPSTGDTTNTAPWYAILVLSGLGLAMLALARRNKFD